MPQANTDNPLVTTKVVNDNRLLTTTIDNQLPKNKVVNDNQLLKNTFGKEKRILTAKLEKDKQALTTTLVKEEECTCRHKSTKKPDYIQMKIDEYSESFTIHGLTRSIKGRKIESLSWSIIVLLGVFCCSMVIHGLVKKFQSYSVYTEIRFQITDRNYFPSVTICEKNLLLDAFFAYCGVPPRIAGWSQIDLSRPCSNNRKIKATDVKSKPYKYWATDWFNITTCETWGGKRCASSRYFETVRKVNNSCITWNHAGNFYDMYSHADIEFTFKKPSHLRDTNPQMIVILNDPRVKDINIARKLDLETNRYHLIKIDKTIIKRLPAPYPANCTNTKAGHIFPGKYSRHSCIESRTYIEMFKQCGDTLDYTRDYIPENIKRKYGRRRPMMDVLACIANFSGNRHASHAIHQSNCQFPCEDLDLNVVSSVHQKTHEHFARTKNDTFRYQLHVQFQRVDTYKIMEEKELYTWDQMACEIGGFIGLIMGMSIISLVEVFAYIALKIAKSFVGNNTD